MTATTTTAASASSSTKLKHNMPLAFVDDCDRPACDDVTAKIQAMAAQHNNTTTKPAVDELLPLHGRAQAHAHAHADAHADAAVVKCPPSKGEIGKAGWTLLHSMAAWYPEAPTEMDQIQMTQFMHAFAQFFPCTWCAKDFKANLEKKPPQTSSRKDLCIWMCEQHNLVNQKLGKPTLDCDMKILDERWRKSTHQACQPPPVVSPPKSSSSSLTTAAVAAAKTGH